MWIIGLAILMGFYGLGVLLQTVLHVPLPGNVMGMILLLLALFSGVVKLEWVERAAGFFNRHLLLFFIPVIVGIVEMAPALQSNWLALLMVLIASTLIPLVLSGWSVSAALQTRAGKRGDKS